MSPWERYARFLVRRAWAVVAAVVLVTAGLAVGIRYLHAEFSIESVLPANHPFVRIDQEIRREFGGRRTMVVAIVPRSDDVWRTDVLQIVQDVTLEGLRLPDVMGQNVVSLAAPGVRYAWQRDDAIEVDLLMRDVPQTAEEIAELRRKVESDPQLRGILVTPDQKAALVFLDFWESASADDVVRNVLDLATRYPDRPVDFYFAGEPMTAVNEREQSGDVAKRIPFTFLVIALMLLVSFRSVQGMLVPMLTACLSVVWAFGLMGYTGIAIDSWNVAVPILLIAVAAAHSAQMLKRYAEELAVLGDNRAAVIASTATMGPVMIAAGMTAAFGFASLALFGVRSIANFGLACGYGIASAVLLEMTFIPALRALLPAPRHVPVEGGATKRFLDVLERGILEAHGRRIMVGTGIALGLAAVGTLFLHTYGSTREYLPRDGMTRRHLEEIERHFPGTVTMTILYEGGPESARTAAVLQHVAALQVELERDPLVLRTASLADIVKALHRTFNPEDPVPYRVPDDQPLVAQLMYFGESPAFERFTDRALSKVLVLAYLRDDDSARVGPLIQRTQAWLDAHPAPSGVRVLVAGGVGPTILAVQEHTTYGKMLNMLVVLAVIYAISSLVFRSPLAGIFVVSPIVLTVAMLFGLLGWTGIRLDMGSATIIAMAAGVGADYAIYFLYRLREERQRLGTDDAAFGAALHTSGRAVLFVATSIGAGFAVMALSRFPGMRLFGVLMPVAMITACLASLSIMPVLVRRTRPSFVFGEPSAAEPPRARRAAGA